MNKIRIGIAFVLIVCAPASGNEPVSWPKDVPPVLGVAVVSQAVQGGTDSEWTIQLNVPKISWTVVGKPTPKYEWSELQSDIQKATLTLRMGGPSALAPSRVVDIEGKELTPEAVSIRLKQETPVLVSVSGRMPDPYFLQLTRPDALIVILGARDAYPVPELLPAESKGSANPRNGGDQ